MEKTSSRSENSQNDAPLTSTNFNSLKSGVEDRRIAGPAPVQELMQLRKSNLQFFQAQFFTESNSILSADRKELVRATIDLNHVVAHLEDHDQLVGILRVFFLDCVRVQSVLLRNKRSNCDRPD